MFNVWVTIFLSVQSKKSKKMAAVHEDDDAMSVMSDQTMMTCELLAVCVCLLHRAECLCRVSLRAYKGDL